MRLIEVGIFSFGSSIKEDMLASVDTLRVCFYQLHSLFLFSLSLVVGFVVGRESLLVFCGSFFFSSAASSWELGPPPDYCPIFHVNFNVGLSFATLKTVHKDN